uniref:Uncharacterized protein n=1 Tax=Siphoviridae sp. ct33S22 TaxID=2826279 RepID=A0A8S5QLC3_9CAUD|nr:MAG TPA: hypothetical protein [Siphoviridae sp. ct33S22]
MTCTNDKGERVQLCRRAIFTAYQRGRLFPPSGGGGHDGSDQPPRAL